MQGVDECGLRPVIVVKVYNGDVGEDEEKQGEAESKSGKGEDEGVEHRIANPKSMRA